MAKRLRSMLLLSATISAQLLTSGCLFGGGGASVFASLFSLFGSGSSGSSGSQVLSFLFETGSNASAEGGSSGDSFLETPAAATVHNPEPASLALFGVGLGGLSWARRRKRCRSK